MAARAPILVVAGNIATGKTQLVETVGGALELPRFLERWQENPWFSRAPRDEFAAQMWFLLAAAADNARMTRGGVQERCIHEHACVFAREQLAGEDARLVHHVYTRLDARLPDPNLLIHLKASVPELQERVRLRGRAQEQDLSIEQLQKLEDRYRQLIGGWTRCPVLEVDTEEIDLRSPEGIRHVLDWTSEELS